MGVLDNGELMVNEEGSAQGNIISPILANIYMHNVLTLWYKFIITKECKGDNFLIVYADDFVAGFQGIKIELLGIAIILLGIAVTTNNFWGYVLGVLGFGVAVVGCFLKDNH